MNKPSIIFDFRYCQNNLNRGVGRYSVDLIKNFINGFRDKYDFFLLVNYNNDIPFLDFDIQFICEEELSQYEITKEFDIYFCCNFFDSQISSPPINKKIASISKIITGLLYDLIPLVFAGNYLFNGINNNEKYLRLKYALGLSSLKILDHIFTISECTKNDYLKFLGGSSDRLTNIYGGVDKKFFVNNKYDFKKRKNNLVYVAGNDKRKNYVNTVKAFENALIKNKIPKNSTLYIVCNVNQIFINNCKSALVNSELFNKNIVITGFLDDSKMIELVKNAKSSIFSSYYEGLGLPILESYAIGTPVFASNTSSTKELIRDECGFDPHCIENIEQAICLSLCDETICNLSLTYGHELLSRINWFNTCKYIDEKLSFLIERYKEPIKVTAMYGCLPPNDSGIAEYNRKILEYNNKRTFVFVSDFNNYADFNLLNKHTKIFLSSIESLPFLANKFSIKKNIIVLGNSHHNLPYLRLAINELRYDKEKILLLHEVNLINLWMSYLLDLSNLKIFINKWYPEKKDKLHIKNVDSVHKIGDLLRKENVFFIRPLLRLSNSKNIIVHNQEAYNLLKKELTASEFSSLNVKVLFHAIEQLDIRNEEIKNNNQYVVGTFGIPGNAKYTDVLIDAIIYLNNNQFPVKLVIAGFSVDSYIITFKGRKLPDYISSYSNPSNTELYKLMKSTDLAVQLRRYPTNGESSGIISSLLSLKTNILINESFLNNQAETVKDVFYVLNDNFDYITLGRKIKETLLRKHLRPKANKDYVNLSYESYISQLLSD